MKKFFDIIFGIISFAILAIPMILIAFMIKLTSKGPILFWSDRVGRHNLLFKMPKFRTMRIDTPNVATHLLSNPGQFTTPIGKLLRKTSLDEIPQLWNVIKGDMVFVGPWPALYNQDDLINLRTKRGIHKLTPGITGWAQIQGRDELAIPEKVEMDFFYLNNRSVFFDLKILFNTIFTTIRIDGISH